MTEKLPIWRNPVLILVFVLPAISIIAGVGLLVMALRTGGDDPVLDEVRRTARGAQVTDLSADQAALDGRFAAVVRVDAENGAVVSTRSPSGKRSVPSTWHTFSSASSAASASVFSRRR